MTWQPGDWPTTPCIEWEGSTNTSGYGRARFKGPAAHREAVKAPPGSVVIHICDNPPCVNPEHLVIGTTQQNAEDRAIKQKSRRTQIMPYAREIYRQVFPDG